jgi:hypothetical protein
VSKEFEIRREVELPGTPEQVWDAAATGPGNAGWLWPIEIEPGVAGKAEFGTVTAWDPPRHFAVRAEGEDGWFNSLEWIIEARAGGSAVVRYVHSGIFVDDWDSQYDSAGRHTDFYLHTLGQYLRYFPGQLATYLSVDGPASSATPEAFATVRRALGLTDATPGDPVRLSIPSTDQMDGVVDYVTDHFAGIRTDDGLVRVFGRGAWGAPVTVVYHVFNDRIDQHKTEQAWRGWLDELFQADAQRS